MSWKAWRSLSLFLLLVLLLFEAVSGLYLYLAEDLGKTVMALLLLHVGLGVAAVAPFLVFMARHVRAAADSQILGAPVDRALRTGAWLTLLLSLLSGIYLFFAGVVYPTEVPVWWAHVVVSAVGLVLLVLHMQYRSLTLGSGRTMQGRFKTLVWRSAAACLVALAVVFALAAMVRFGTRGASISHYDVVKDDAFFEPGQMTANFKGLADPAAFENSRACGLSGCHEGIYREWLETPHFRSANPLMLRVEESLEEQVGGHSAIRTCGVCHIPVATLTGKLHNMRATMPREQVAQQLRERDEGSSCVFCHSIRDVRRAGGGANVMSSPRELVFTDGVDPLRNFLYKKAVAMKPKAHGQSYTRPFYGRSKACAGCHDRMQLESWVQTSYANPHDPKETKHCQACHMPAIALDDEVITRLESVTKTHRFPGANQFIADWYGYPAQAEVNRRFMADKRILLEAATPPRVAAGTRMPLRVSLFNNQVGHFYPSGPELDLIEAWIEIHAVDAGGHEFYATGVPDASHHLSRDTYVYTQMAFDVDKRLVHSVHGHRHTTWYWNHALVHVIPAEEVDDVAFRIPVPASLNGKSFRLRIALRQRKPTQLFLDWAFPGKTAPVLTVAEADVEVPLGPGPTARFEDLRRPFPGKKRCEPYYMRRLSLRPNVLRLTAYQAVVDFKRGKRQEAFRRLSDLRRRYGTSSYEVEVAYGELLHRQGREAEAEACLRRALTLRPHLETWGRTILAEVLEGRGQKEEAASLRAEAERNAAMETAVSFEREEYVPPETIRDKNSDEIRRRIDRGDYDAEFPYVVINRGREVTAR